MNHMLKSMAFKCEILKRQSEVSIVLVGIMDERMELPGITDETLLKVDIGRIEYINSIGIRKWVRWMQELNGKDVHLENCPVIFVKNLATIKGMLGSKTKVTSFFVPYYNEETHQRRNVLFKLGEQYQDSGLITLPKHFESGVGDFEPDVIEEIYFSFLRR